MSNRKIFGQTTFKKWPKQPTNLKYGQISEIWLQNGKSGNPASDGKWAQSFQHQFFQAST